MTTLLLAALFFEMGLALLVIPWSIYWDRNLFTAMVPGLRGLLANDFVRGAVSGLGVVNLAAGAAELYRLFKRRHEALAHAVTSAVKDV